MYSDDETHDSPHSQRKIPPAASMFDEMPATFTWILIMKRLVIERAAGMYSALPYALAQVIIELPHILVQALVYGIIVYAMMGFECTTSKLLVFLHTPTCMDLVLIGFFSIWR